MKTKPQQQQSQLESVWYESELWSSSYTRYLYYRGKLISAVCVDPTGNAIESTDHIEAADWLDVDLRTGRKIDVGRMPIDCELQTDCELPID